jgi:hypothetical protein
MRSESLRGWARAGACLHSDAAAIAGMQSRSRLSPLLPRRHAARADCAHGLALSWTSDFSSTVGL